MMRKTDEKVIGGVTVEIWEDRKYVCYARIPGLRLGRWQQRVLLALVYHGRTQPLKWLRGEAANWYSSYRRSMESLVKKLRAAGLPVQFVPGPNGGAWSGKIILKEVER